MIELAEEVIELAEEELYLGPLDTLTIRNTADHTIRLETKQGYVNIPSKEAVIVIREPMYTNYSEQSKWLYKLLHMSFWQRLKWTFSRNIRKMSI